MARNAGGHSSPQFVKVDAKYPLNNVGGDNMARIQRSSMWPIRIDGMTVAEGIQRPFGL